MATTSNHPVKGAKVTAWGDRAPNSGAGDAVTLECGSCHDPHGNGNYRILRPIPPTREARLLRSVSRSLTRA
jgi:cytochrome c553